MNCSETNFHPAVSDAEFKRFLRFPPRRPLEGPLAENAAWARSWFATHARPWFCVRELRVTVESGVGVFLASGQFGGPALAARFAGIKHALAVAASAGPETDAETAARWAQHEPDRYFFLESYGAAVVENLVAEAGRRLATLTGDHIVLPHYCPGFPDWVASEAPAFLAQATAAGALPGPLEALPTGVLRPKKSKLALFGLKPLVVPVAP
jgi:hypothetical protein